MAVLKESIPYDFGGIDVIDELPLPPLGKSQEPDAEPAETTEGASTTQSTTSSSSQTTTPEAPSLTNMVTAAEDFIKVLATVSTSQGSSPDAAKEETQGSEKKRKKNAGGKKRKNKKRRGRGRGRKRRPNVETVVKTDEGAVGAPSCHVPEEITSRTNIIEDPSRSKEVDNFMRSEADLEIKEELSNSMMRDDPQGPAGATSTSAPAETVKAARQRDEVSESESALSPTTTPSPTVYLGITKTKTHRERVRLGQKRLRHKLRAVTPSSSTLKPPHEATQETPSVTTSVTEGGKSITVEQLQAEAAGQPSSGTLGNASEEGPVATTAGAPTTNPLQAKRLRSKERGGRKRAGKVKATFQREESHQTDSGEEPTVVTPVLSASEVSMLGYHVFPKRLDYLSVARRARPTISKPIEPSRKGKRRRSKESRERRKSSHILGATFTPTATLAPISTHTTSVQYSDKADYERMVTASASVTVVPPPSDTSSLAQFRSAIHDTSTQETLLFPLTGIPPGGTQKPKRKRQGRREMKKQKKVLSVLSGA